MRDAGRKRIDLFCKKAFHQIFLLFKVIGQISLADADGFRNIPQRNAVIPVLVK